MSAKAPLTKPPTATAPPPIAVSEKSLLKQRAYDSLKRWIQDNTFAPGDFLSERQLAIRLGMSKTPVKAALERLEAEGFIAVSPQQGIVVRDLSVQQIADQFELRLALESFVLRAVSGRLSGEQTTRLRQNLSRQEYAAKETDHGAAIELDAEFHLLFCEFLGNQEIVRVMSHLRDRIHRVVSGVFDQHPDRYQSSYREHLAIAEAVLASDADLATAALERHLNFGKKWLLSPRRERRDSG